MRSSLGENDRGRTEIDVFGTTVWNCISKACQDVLRDSGISNELVKGIGFDATCSLAVTDLNGSPMSVTPGSWSTASATPIERDIILWADHRAKKEANLINASGSSVLKYVGGTMSLEMELPKMLWLKNHMPKEVFEQSLFFDLPDWLTFKATGSMARSNCSLACKCSYVPPGVEGSKGWNAELFTKIGLGEFVRRSCSLARRSLIRNSQVEKDFSPVGGIPGRSGLILTAGQPVGQGLSAASALELGLLPGTPVGSAVIDAYAGWVGTVAAPMEGADEPSLAESAFRLAAIAGTSTCHIVQSPEPVFVKGVWGPYQHAIFPGCESPTLIACHSD